LAPLLTADDIIWVQDYHLIPLARELRRLGVGNRIGFFLHTPWPAHQLMVTLPRHRELVSALFDFDMVGFQTPDYRQAFEEYVLTEAEGAKVSDTHLRAFGRTVRVESFPIGLDANEFARMVDSPSALRTYDIMMAHTAFRRLIVGVDRLDYSKGLEERFLGFERFLADNPDMRREVLMLQIAPVSRDAVDSYQEIRARLDSLSGRINGEYADIDWNPVRYVNRNYRRDELAGVYRAAKVGLVTPLRDGMNLVAKEFVAAQDPEDPGVLVLSRFAGAADQLKDAVLVNPNSPEEIADALKRALSMDRGERQARWRSMFQNIRREDVDSWRDSFVDALKSVGRAGWPGHGELPRPVTNLHDFKRGAPAALPAVRTALVPENAEPWLSSGTPRPPQT
ncbi:MAG TPA: trehalose-6-phosphate synthase, partial [Phenylobacterium sp.]|nr:trehalose-6-phosphate synthase [Phenylobacterium sp.]